MVSYLPIKRYPDYLVGDDGSVWSNKRKKWKRLKPQYNKTSGYAYVSLYNSPKRTGKYIHQLVLESFVGSPPLGMECCHEDGNRKNNRRTNLRYDYRSGNQRDRMRHGTLGRKLTLKLVRKIRVLANRGWNYDQLARKF